MTVTSAPRAAASSASAKPMRPELRLPTKRTESIGSRVPPAVTSTFSPSQGRPPAGTTASTAASSSAGSARRPMPHSCLEPSAPVPGSTTITPRSRRSARLACVAACSYMWLFIAGATSTGQVAASAAEVSRLSARPWASLAIVLAVAGAIRKASALRTSSRWLSGSCCGAGWSGNAPRAGSRSNSSVRTGAPVRAANDAAPDEALGRRRLDDAHGVPGLGGQAHHLERLVGGDSAADAEEDATHVPR